MRIEPAVEAAPLLAVLDRLSAFPWHGSTRLEPAVRRAMDRGRVAGSFTVWMADRLAITVLGQHPCEVYGDDWWTCG